MSGFAKCSRMLGPWVMTQCEAPSHEKILSPGVTTPATGSLTGLGVLSNMVTPQLGARSDSGARCGAVQGSSSLGLEASALPGRRHSQPARRRRIRVPPNPVFAVVVFLNEKAYSSVTFITRFLQFRCNMNFFPYNSTSQKGVSILSSALRMNCEKSRFQQQ